MDSESRFTICIIGTNYSRYNMVQYDNKIITLSVWTITTWI